MSGRSWKRQTKPSLGRAWTRVSERRGPGYNRLRTADRLSYKKGPTVVWEERSREASPLSRSALRLEGLRLHILMVLGRKVFEQALSNVRIGWVVNHSKGAPKCVDEVFVVGICREVGEFF